MPTPIHVAELERGRVLALFEESSGGGDDVAWAVVEVVVVVVVGALVVVVVVVGALVVVVVVGGRVVVVVVGAVVDVVVVVVEVGGRRRQCRRCWCGGGGCRIGDGHARRKVPAGISTVKNVIDTGAGGVVHPYAFVPHRCPEGEHEVLSEARSWVRLGAAVPSPELLALNGRAATDEAHPQRRRRAVVAVVKGHRGICVDAILPVPDTARRRRFGAWRGAVAAVQDGPAEVGEVISTGGLTDAGDERGVEAGVRVNC